MAQIACGLGVPHTPAFPLLAARLGPSCEIARFFARTKAALDDCDVDAIVIFTTDHLNNFFLDNYPMFAIGEAESTNGPIDIGAITPLPAVEEEAALAFEFPFYSIPSDAGSAAHLRAACIAADYDIALVQRYSVDHSVVVPLHFLRPAMDLPVIPIFINGHLPPLPTAQRCYALGKVVRQAVEAWQPDLRIAMIGSGSFSLEVFGPRITPGDHIFGVPDPDWVERIEALLLAGEIEQLVAEATPQRMAAAGNVGGELLNWLAMLGTLANPKADWVERQAKFGHAFAYFPETGQ